MTDQGDMDIAVSHFIETLKLNPAHQKAYFNIGVLLSNTDIYPEVVKKLSEALHIHPSVLHNNMGSVLAKRGKLPEAITHFSKALIIDPKNADTHFNMGALMNIQKHSDKAIYHFSRAIQTDPNYVKAHSALGNIRNAQGETAEAIRHYAKALAASPDYTDALNNLAWIYATSLNLEFRNGEKAVRLAEHLCEITGCNNPSQLDTLAAAYAEADLFNKAVATAQKALSMAISANHEKMMDVIGKRLKLYRSGQPFYDG